MTTVLHLAWMALLVWTLATARDGLRDWCAWRLRLEELRAGVGEDTDEEDGDG